MIASRGSRLALRQVEIVSEQLRAVHPEVEVQVHIVKTQGDRDQRPFAAIGGKGLFTSEVERAVVEGEADVAVHSAKDVTAELAEGCALVCIPARANVADVVVGGEGVSGEERLGSLPDGAKVGTSSMRRRALLAEARPDLETVELRGNLDTRLGKVADGAVDAAILAAAGIERLGPDVPLAALGSDWWVPAPGQGALALEALAERADVAALLAPIEDATARAELEAERAFGLALEGGCSVPLGCLARANGGHLTVVGYLALPDASRSMRDRISGAPHEAEALGRELARAILEGGGDEILEELRYEEAPPVSPP